MNFDKIKERYLSKGSFGANALTLITGTTIAQAIPILISPVLTRIYNPSDYGVLALFGAFVAVISIVAHGRYDLAVMLPEDDKEGASLVFLSGALALTTSILSLIIFLVFSKRLSVILGNPAISGWLYLVPLAVLAVSVNDIFTYWTNRRKRFKDLAYSRIAESVVSVTVKLGMGLMGYKPAGLIIGMLLGQIEVVYVLVSRTIKNEKGSFLGIDFKSMMSCARRYSNFLKFSTVGAIFNVGSKEIPVILLAVFFNPAVVGFFALAKKLMNLSINAFGQSITQVFYQKVSECRFDGTKTASITMELYKKLLYVSIIPAMAVFVYGDWMFSFVFGSKWFFAGRYAQALSFWMLFTFVSQPFASLLAAFEKQKNQMIFDGVLFALQVFTISVGAVAGLDAFSAVLAFAVVSAIVRFGFTLYCLKMAGLRYGVTVLFTSKIIAIVLLPVLVPYHYS